MSRENEPCAQQLTGSCEGCPVLYILRDELRNNPAYDPGVTADLKNAARIIAQDNCPEGLTPQTDHLIIERKGNGWTGRYTTVNVRR